MEIISLSENIIFVKEHFQPNALSVGKEMECVFLNADNSVYQSHTHLLSKADHYLKKDEIISYLNSKSETEILLIIHGLDFKLAEILLNCSIKGKVKTIFYGFEFYANWNSTLYQDSTDKLLAKLKRTSLSSRIDSKRDKFYLYRKRKQWIKAMDRVNTIAHYLKPEYDLFVGKLKLKAGFQQFNYGLLKDLVSVDENKNKEARNILIGSSASASNNHLEIFEKIKNSADFSGKIYCPLNYGLENELYRDAIIEKGNQLFGSRFTPILEMMSPEDYNALLSTCETVILNHNRSQGGGSVWQAIVNGTTLFLSPNNPMYVGLQEKGIHVFSIEDEIDLNKKLKEEEQLQNRENFLNIFSDQNVLNNYRELLESN